MIESDHIHQNAQQTDYSDNLIPQQNPPTDNLKDAKSLKKGMSDS